MRCFLLLLLIPALASHAIAADATVAPRCNVVVILADDLGYGDVGCYNPNRGKIPTPRIDQLAQEGMRFTDSHSSSGVCSPTRYSILTGRYHWRTRLQQGIVGVWGAPLIAADRLTIAGLAKQNGYHTACVGKWHLGWDWPIAADEMKHFRNLGGQAGGGGKVTTDATPEQVATWKKVFAQKIAGGPTARGFDEYFGTDVPNWPPYCFIENDRTVGVPSTLLPATDLVKNQASLQGPALPGWKLDAVLPALADRACDVIAKQAKAKKPFLLYLPLTAPHTPIAVAKEWQGKSNLKHAYADFVMQTDATIGRVLDALATAGVADNTLVLFTSDNGCAPYIGAKDLEAKGHYPSGPLRGYKADAWEGGHRVPFIVRWPGIVKPGTTCERTICSVDILGTLAELWDVKLPPNIGEDSVSLMPLLRGEHKPIHESVVHHSSTGIFAIRSGKWKLILGPGNGPANGTKPHLYDLSADLGEKDDLAAAHPDVVKKLTEQMERFVADGRSTPGEKQQNDVAIQLVKRPKADNPPKKDAPKKDPRYNVLFIMADDLRPAMGCYGDKQAKTPNLDRLAERGIRFDKAYVQYPVCNPSRVSLLTSTRPEHNGVTGNGTFFREKMPDIVTLPQLFRQQGGTAVSYGKIYHAGLVEGEIENKLLDQGKSWDEAKMFRPTKEGNTGPRRNLTGGKLKWCEIADLEGSDDDQSDGQTAKQAIAAMERLAGKPWFIGAGFHRPHDPFVVSKRYVAQYPKGSLKLHRDPADASELLKHSIGGGAFAEAFKNFSDQDRMDFLTHYYAGVSQTDAQVGRLMDAMDRLKLWDKTVVVFVGDHGYHLGERGWWNKNTLFDRSCRAPFLIVAPGVKPAMCKSLVEFLDIYPTIAELCGLPVPATVKGISLKPILTEPAKSLHDSVLTHITRGPNVTGFGLRTDRYRYIEWSDGGMELYDHQNDPEEWHNLAGIAANAKVLVELMGKLAASR